MNAVFAERGFALCSLCSRCVCLCSTAFYRGFEIADVPRGLLLLMDNILHHLPPEVRDNRIASQPVTRRTGEGVPAFPRIQCWPWGPSGGARFRPFGPGSGSAQVWGNVKFQGAHGECPCLPFCRCVRTSGGARFRPSTVCRRERCLFFSLAMKIGRRER